MSDIFNRKWITDHAVEICADYEWGVLTLRGLHYQLVALGMTNSVQHYKRVVSAMIKARRDGTVAYEQFSDHDREMIGYTDWRTTDLDSKIESGKEQIKSWMDSYYKNRWENQDYYLEVWIEKKALQGLFGPVCSGHWVALCPCKGYPSLTFLNDAAERFREARGQGKSLAIAYFGDHDPSGEDIPRSIAENLLKDFGVAVDVDVRALTAEQCIDMNLPPAPAKKTDSRTAKFTGLGQVELDAVKPEVLKAMASDAIADYFDASRYKELNREEESERQEYRIQLKEFITTL